MTPLLAVENLGIRFGKTEAVRSVSFSIDAGKILAVVGESGSGKSVTALSLARLLPAAPACETTGAIFYKGENIFSMPEVSLRKLRGREIAYIFQEPGTSLNPSYTVGFQIAEAIKWHLPDVKNVRERVVKSLDEVGIRDAQNRVDAYPHELSGGMQQRVMIAMALACEPRLLIADEPTTALDVTIQRQIISLLAELRKNRGLSILLITHNFGIVANFADEVAVMYRGEIVERGATGVILKNPKHAYTRQLIACIPRLGQKRHRLATIGEMEVSR